MTDENEEPRMLGECRPGDIVVVEVDDVYRFIYIGNLTGAVRKGKKVVRPPEGALVHRVDPMTLFVVPNSCEPGDVEWPVIARVARVEFMRNLREVGKREWTNLKIDDYTIPIDPLARSVKERAELSTVDIPF